MITGLWVGGGGREGGKEEKGIRVYVEAFQKRTNTTILSLPSLPPSLPPPSPPPSTGSPPSLLLLLLYCYRLATTRAA